MRKDFIYSLAALAALPMVGNAAEGQAITGAVDNSTWTGSGTIAKDVVTWTKGEISLSLGNRIKGNYTFKCTLKNPDGKVKVTVGGQSKTYDKATSTNVEIEFTLASAADVNVTISPLTSGKTYIVSGTELSFDKSNFTESIAALEKMAAQVSYKLKNVYTYTTSDRDADQLTLGTIVKSIDAIKLAMTYENYVNNNLADYTNCEIAQKIKEVDENAKSQQAKFDNEQAYKNAIQNITNIEEGTYAALKLAVNGTKDDVVQNAFDDITTSIQTFKDDAKKAYQDGTAKDFDYATTGKNLTNINNAINALSTKVSTTLGYYNQIMTQVNDRKSVFRNLQDSLLAHLSGADYKEWLQAAQDLLDDTAVKTSTVQNATQTKYDSSNLIEKDVADQIALLPTYADYESIRKYVNDAIALQNQYKTNTDAITTLNTNLKGITPNQYLSKDTIEGGRMGVYTQKKSAINGEITTLSEAIEKNNKAHTIYAADATTIQQNIDRLATYVLIENVFYLLEGENFENSTTTIYGYSADEYVAKSLWKNQATETNIKQKINAGKVSADACLNGSSYSYADDKKIITDAIDKYSTDALDAFNKFKTLKENSKAYDKAIRTIETKLSDMTVKGVDPSEYGKTGDSYAKQLEKFNASFYSYTQEIANALKKYDEAHYTALKAIGTDASLEAIRGDKTKTFTDAITNDQAKYDSQLQLKQRNSLQEIVKKALENVKDSLTKLSVVNAADAKSVYGDGADFVTELQARYTRDNNRAVELGNDYTKNKDKVDADGTYTNVISNLTSISNSLDSLASEINEALVYADKCKNNKGAYDKAYTDKVATLSKQITDAKNQLKDTDAKNVYSDDTFQKEWDAIETLRGNLDTDTKASYNKITLVADSASLIFRYNDIVTKISKNVDAAKAEQTKYNNSEASYTTLLGICSSVDDAITNAKANCTINDPLVGKTYYADQVLGTSGTYQSQLNQIKTDMNSKRTVRDCQSIEVAYTESLTKLITAINKEPDNAATNLSHYNTVLGYETEIKNTWNDVSYYISSTDLSSKKAEYQAELKSISENDMAAYHQNAAETYSGGGFVASDAVTNKRAEKTELITKINDIMNRQKEGYSAAIVADNTTRYRDFNMMFSQAEQSFINYVDTLNAYKNLRTKELQSVVSAIIEKSDGLNNELYTGVYTQKLAALREKTDTEYLTANATPGAIFDSSKPEVSGRYKDAKDYKEALERLFNDFKAKVYVDANTLWDSKGYQGKLTEAKNAIKTYTDAAKNNAFSDIEKYVNQGESASASADNLQLSSLDDAMANLVDFDAQLLADKNKAAETDIQTKLGDAKKIYSQKLEFINSLNVNSTTKEAISTEYNRQVNNSLTQAVELFNTSTNNNTQFDSHDAINQLIANFNGITYLETFETNKDNYDKVVNSTFEKIVSTFEVTADTISSYYIAEQFQLKLYNLNSELEDKMVYVNSTYLSSGKVDVDNVNAFNTNFLAQLISLVKEATTTEFLHLKGDVNVLNAEFLKLTEDQREEQASLKIEIDAISKGLNGVYATTVSDKDRPGKLVALEDRIALVRTSLAKINPASTDAAIAGDLQDQLTALSDTADLTGYSDYVKEKVNDDQTTVKGYITSTQQFLVDYKDSVVYYKEKIQSRIDLLTKAVNELITNAEAAKAVQTASDLIADKIEEKIKQASQAVTDAQERMNQNTFWKSENYEDDWTEIDGQISKKTSDLATKKANAELKDNTIFDADLNSIQTLVKNLLDDAAFNELSESLKNLNTNVQKANTVYTSKTYAAAKKTEFDAKLQAIRDEIKNDITSKKTTTEWVDSKLDTYVTKIAEIQKKLDDFVSLTNNYQLGDLDHDGSVAMGDFGTLIDYVLGNKTLPATDSEEFKSLDLNADGFINVTDAVKLQNLRMNYVPSTSMASAYIANAVEALNLQTVSESDNVTRVAVNLTNAQAYVAYQMDVKLPANMKLVGESLTSRSNDHMIFTNDVDESTRIVVASAANNALKGNEGAVLYLDIETVGNFDASQIEFSNIIFATGNAQSTVMTLGGEATGINTVEGTAESLKAKIYNVGGKLMNQLKKGVNIIRNNDGSTQKVIKK